MVENFAGVAAASEPHRDPEYATANLVEGTWSDWESRPYRIAPGTAVAPGSLVRESRLQSP